MNKLIYIISGVVISIAVPISFCWAGDFDALENVNITKVILTYTGGKTVVTDKNDIDDLVTAMKSAVVDNTPYDMLLRTKIEFYSDNTLLVSAWANAPLFRIGKNQYYDKSGRFKTIMRKLMGEYSGKKLSEVEIKAKEVAERSLKEQPFKYILEEKGHIGAERKTYYTVIFNRKDFKTSHILGSEARVDKKSFKVKWVHFE